MNSFASASLLRTTLLTLTVTATALVGLTAPQNSFAQESGAKKPVEEIFVTARKRQESVQDVPATVAVFTENDIERSNITRAGDIALLTPGVSLVDAAEVGDTQVNIRGMNGARDAENSYALVIDGVTYTNPAALNREYANLQQIEVMKGPQGAIYGRNASAGAFIITTKLPDEGLEGQLKTSIGQDETYSLNGAYGGRVSDNLLASVQAEFSGTNGFYNNEFLGRDDVIDNQDIWAVSGRLLWEISDNTTLDSKLRYGEVDGSSIAFNSVFHVPGFAGVNPDFYEDVNEHPMRFVNNVVHTNDQEATEFSLKLDHDMDWATLTAWGLYSDIENELGADGTSAAFGFFGTEPNAAPSCLSSFAAASADPNAALNSPQFYGSDPSPFDPGDFTGSVFGAYTPTTCDGTQYQRRNQEDYSFEIRLASNGDGPIQWMGGLYYLNIEREVAVSTGVDNLNASSGYRGGTVIQAPYTTDPTNPTEQLAWDRFDTDVYSVFANISWDVNDYFTADLAMRYDKEEREVTNLVPTVADGAVSQYINPCGAGFTVGVDTPLNPGLCDTGSIAPKEDDFDQFQPKLSLKWDAMDNTTIFTSIGVGFRSGGFNNQGSKDTVDMFINTGLGLCDPAIAGCVDSGLSAVGIEDSYDKEKSTAFELGLKSTLADGAVKLEAAGYYTEVDDMQFFEFIVGGFGLLRVVENIDDVEITGFEASVTWDAAEWLDLYAGGNVVRSEIKENATRPDTVGNDSPYTPSFTGNLGAYLTFPMGDDLNFFTNVNLSMVGSTWFHVVQHQERPSGFGPAEYSVAERDDYVLANLRAGIESERWTAAIWVDNLTDEDYLEEIIPAPEFGGSFIHVGTERRIGGDITYRF